MCLQTFKKKCLYNFWMKDDKKSVILFILINYIVLLFK